jgi:hypothetical protein
MKLVGALKTLPSSGEERGAARHSLSLFAQAASSRGGTSVVVHNLSATGLLIESRECLDVDEVFEVELPGAEIRHASVVWRSDDFYGCEFAEAISTAAVSGARLRSPPPSLAAPSPTPSAPTTIRTPQPGQLTLRRKSAIILSLASACWLVIALSVWLIV